jgi:copper(I)-binding protein
MNRTFVLAAALLAAGATHAQVTVDDAWVRATVPQQQASGAFMRIRSVTAARLVQASSPVADVVEIHQMSMHGDVMKMQAVPALELPAGKPVALEPGGYHLMLMQLKRSLKAGERVPLTLLVEGADGKRQSVDVEAAVRALGAGAPGKH